MLGAGTRADILQGNLGGYKGAIFENLMADTLIKKGQNCKKEQFSLPFFRNPSVYKAFATGG